MKKSSSLSWYISRLNKTKTLSFERCSTIVAFSIFKPTSRLVCGEFVSSKICIVKAEVW